jgi:hypothetical protein
MLHCSASLRGSRLLAGDPDLELVRIIAVAIALVGVDRPRFDACVADALPRKIAWN